MGINLFGLLNMGKDSLAAQQRALDVTSHNIANANTPGYSRQRAILGTNRPLDTMTPDSYSTSGQYGTGAQVSSVQRVRDLFLDTQVRDSTMSLNNWQEREQALSQVQEIFMELGDDAINSDLNAFWDSWHALAQDPTSTSYRMDVWQKGQKVAASLNRIYNELNDLRLSIDDNLAADVVQINTLADKVAKLNVQIMETEATGQHANDLRDQRDLLVDQLAEYADIQVSENPRGAYTVSINEYNLVQEGTTMRLSTYINSKNDGLRDIYWTNTGQPAVIEGGKIAGILAARDEIVPGYMQQVAAFGQSLTTQVNAQHNTVGLTLSGAPAGDFFTFDAITNIISVAMAHTAVADIAAARFGQGAGDNGNAVAMANLRDTINDQYVSMVSDYGQAAQNAQMYVDMKSSVKAQLEERRDGVSGVSLDEEMANMIKFQQAYNAAARMITTVDEMLTTVLNMGTVGR
jgi:flagellar hook-associated protein 1 FlgK